MRLENSFIRLVVFELVLKHLIIKRFVVVVVEMVERNHPSLLSSHLMQVIIFALAQQCW